MIDIIKEILWDILIKSWTGIEYAWKVWECDNKYMG